MNRKVAIILINYKDYAEKYLDDCLASLRKQDYLGEMKIFIVDNETSGESFGLINKIVAEKNPPGPLYQGGEMQEGKMRGGEMLGGENVETRHGACPSVEIILNKNNDGFAKGNNDAMRLALAQGFDYVVLFNMDTVVEASCVTKMVEAGKNPPNPLYQGGKMQLNNQGGKIGVVQARLMLYPDKERVNSLGNATHFLGFGYGVGYNEKFNPPSPLYQGGKMQEGEMHGGEICYPSGAAVLFTREMLEKIGLFDEEFWMYNEDQDIGLRAWLAGYKCVLASEAVAYHKYEFSRSVQKYYWMDRNRIIVLLKFYKILTLLLILPAFVVMEFGLLFFAWQGGWLKEKNKSLSIFFSNK